MISRAYLLEAIRQASGAINQKGIVPQSDCAILHNGAIWSYDDDLFCRVDVGIPPHLTAVVNGKDLLNVVSRIPDKEVIIHIIESSLVITGDSAKRRCGITIQQDIDSPVLSLEIPEDWYEVDSSFSYGLGLVAPYTNEDTSFALGNVHITGKYVEACNNNQVSRYNIKSIPKSNFLIRGTVAKHLSTLEMDGIALSDSWVFFRNDNATFGARLYKDEYPRLARIMSLDNPKSLKFPKISTAINLAQLFSRDDVHRLIDVHLTTGIMTVRSENASGWFTEDVSCDYEGDALDLCIPAETLKVITEQDVTCQIDEHRIKFKSGDWVFVSSLVGE